MGKFLIVDKTPKGMQPNKYYKIRYQENGKPEIKTTQMICVLVDNTKIMAFLSNSKETTIKEKDRKEFIKELKLFQTGSAYRKTHPVVLSPKDILKQQIEELNKKLKEIESTEKIQLAAEFDQYYNSNKSLKEYKKALDILLKNKDFSIKNCYFNNKSYSSIVIWDCKKHNPVEHIFFSLNKTYPLTIHEIEETYKGGK